MQEQNRRSQIFGEVSLQNFERFLKHHLLIAVAVVVNQAPCLEDLTLFRR